jgi:hypothetical protein
MKLKSNVNFEEERHIYTIGNETFKSVSQIIELKYPFNRDLIPEEALKYAIDRGNFIHYMLEQLALNKPLPIKYDDYFSNNYNEKTIDK